MAKPMYKTVVVIWSEEHPRTLVGDGEWFVSALAQEAETGSAYCASTDVQAVADPEADPDWRSDVREFFDTDVDDTWHEPFFLRGVCVTCGVALAEHPTEGEATDGA